MLIYVHSGTEQGVPEHKGNIQRLDFPLHIGPRRCAGIVEQPGNQEKEGHVEQIHILIERCLRVGIHHAENTDSFGNIIIADSLFRHKSPSLSAR